MLLYNSLKYTLTTIALTNPTSSRLVGTCASGSFGSKCGDLLYVDMRAWVAKLMTCARQLHNAVNNLNWTSVRTYLIFILRQSYFFPVVAFSHAASSCIIEELFDALSHVTWPICGVSMSECHLPHQSAYLAFNAHPFENFEEGLTQPLAIVCVAKMCEAKKSALGFPLRWC